MSILFIWLTLFAMVNACSDQKSSTVKESTVVDADANIPQLIYWKALKHGYENGVFLIYFDSSTNIEMNGLKVSFVNVGMDQVDEDARFISGEGILSLATEGDFVILGIHDLKNSDFYDFQMEQFGEVKNFLNVEEGVNLLYGYQVTNGTGYAKYGIGKIKNYGQPK